MIAKEVGYGISSSVAKKLVEQRYKNWDSGDDWKRSVKRCCFAGQSDNGMYRI